MKRLLLSALAVIAVGVGLALAQNVQQQLNGPEAWQVGTGGPGGPGVYTNVSALRGGRNYQQQATGTTITTQISPNVENYIVTGAVTTMNLSLPLAPYDGQTVTISCPGGTVSTLTLSAPFGGTTNQAQGALNPATVITGLNPTACTTTVQVSASMTYTYQATPSTWFRVQ